MSIPLAERLRLTRPILYAYAVHCLTASGAVFAMLALIAAVSWDWSLMFLWLVAAFVVDGIDGPLARKYEVQTNAPRIDGALLDLIVDYLTYVFIPAYALFQSGLLEGLWAWIALISITFASVIYFADTRMKTEDDSFRGFPSCWNLVVLVVFALTPPGWVILAIIALLAPAMFMPLKFVHPTRTPRWRAVSLPVAVAWTGFAGWAAATGFDPESWAHWGLVASSLYLVSAGILQQLIPAQQKDR
ncbi:MAG: CDP-alcohol phosphatidyltransferase family protein [Pseudomonadota bacterium]